MHGLLSSLLALGQNPADDADTRLRKLVLLVAALTIAALAVGWGLLYWIGGATVAALIPWFYTAISIIGVVVFAATRHYTSFAVSQFERRRAVRLIASVLVAAALGACAFPRPPAAWVNGVAGEPVVYCWRSSCADGVVTSSASLPEVSPPFVMSLPPNVHDVSIASFSTFSSLGGSEVAFDGNTIGPVDPDAVMLTVFVSFDGGGDATYHWEIGP